jgi:hypothetical protein
MKKNSYAGYVLEEQLLSQREGVEYWSAKGQLGYADVYVLPRKNRSLLIGLPNWSAFSDFQVVEEEHRLIVVVPGKLRRSLQDILQDEGVGISCCIAWHISALFGELHESGRAHGFIHPSHIGLDQHDHLKVRPALAEFIPSDPDISASALATDCWQLSFVLSQMGVSSDTDPRFGLLISGLQQEVSRLRLQPASAIRQSLTAVIARHPDWEEGTQQKLGKRWALEQVPSVEESIVPHRLERPSITAKVSRSSLDEVDLWASPFTSTVDEQEDRSSGQAMIMEAFRNSDSLRGIELPLVDDFIDEETEQLEPARIQISTNQREPAQVQIDSETSSEEPNARLSFSLNSIIEEEDFSVEPDLRTSLSEKRAKVKDESETASEEELPELEELFEEIEEEITSRVDFGASVELNNDLAEEDPDSSSVDEEQISSPSEQELARLMEDDEENTASERGDNFPVEANITECEEGLNARQEASKGDDVPTVTLLELEPNELLDSNKPTLDSEEAPIDQDAEDSIEAHNNKDINALEASSDKPDQTNKVSDESPLLEEKKPSGQDLESIDLAETEAISVEISAEVEAEEVIAVVHVSGADRTVEEESDLADEEVSGSVEAVEEESDQPIGQVVESTGTEDQDDGVEPDQLSEQAPEVQAGEPEEEPPSSEVKFNEEAQDTSIPEELDAAVNQLLESNRLLSKGLRSTSKTDDFDDVTEIVKESPVKLAAESKFENDGLEKTVIETPPVNQEGFVASLKGDTVLEPEGILDVQEPLANIKLPSIEEVRSQQELGNVAQLFEKEPRLEISTEPKEDRLDFPEPKWADAVGVTLEHDDNALGDEKYDVEGKNFGDVSEAFNEPVRSIEFEEKGSPWGFVLIVIVLGVFVIGYNLQPTENQQESNEEISTEGMGGIAVEKNVEFSTNPPGGKVYIDREDMGMEPIMLTLSEEKSVYRVCVDWGMNPICRNVPRAELSKGAYTFPKEP